MVNVLKVWFDLNNILFVHLHVNKHTISVSQDPKTLDSLFHAFFFSKLFNSCVTKYFNSCVTKYLVEKQTEQTLVRSNLIWIFIVCTCHLVEQLQLKITYKVMSSEMISHIL